jgi:hypothetical protein
MGIRHRGAVALMGSAALFVSLLPTASASYDPLGGGTTKLAIDKGFVSLLKKHGVSLQAKKGAKLKGNVLTLPVSGGEMDPLNGKGTIDHAGTLVFKSAKGSVPFKALTLKAKKTPLTAKVGGSQLKVAKAKTIASKREGFGEGFSAKGLSLTQKVVTRLNKKLGLKQLLKEGQPFGTSTSKTQPTTVAILPTGRATYAPDPTFKAKLDSLFVSVNPIFPAEGGGGVFSFPITVEGAIAPDASQGTLKVAGDLEFLQLGAGQIFWHEPWLDLAAKSTTTEVDIQPTPAFPGKLGRVPTFGTAFSPANVVSDPKARTIAMNGAVATLDAQIAAYFNQAFAKGAPTFAAGEAIGTISFGATSQ